MYSVLFQSQKMMEYYEPYRPLFMPLLKREGLGICQWMEAGTTVDTMIPGIYDLVNDKEEWRAVIMCMNEEENQKAFPSRQENPYDFLENSSSELVTKESRIPLVRLTQMLGGVPSPAMHFTPQIVKEKDKEERMIYTPGIREEDKKVYEELKRKYKFHGKLPSEIILVCPRDRKGKKEEQIGDAWEERIAVKDSDFWRRNGYPARCRFTVFDITREGNVQKSAELFNLWSAVMLLASNEISPSTFQAYRLYRIETEFDPKKLEQAFQETAGRVYRARRSLEQSIRREREKKLNEEVVLPDYQLKAPVVLKLPERSQIFSEDGRFGLTAQTPAEDQEILRDMKEQAQNGLDGIGICTERALDQTSQRIRQYRDYSRQEVYPLNSYQMEDMTRKLEQEYREIFELRKQLPVRRENSRKDLEELSGKIQEELNGRTTYKQASAVWAATSALFVLSLLPGLFFGVRFGKGAVFGTIVFGAACVAVFTGVEVLCLAAQKTKLQLAVNRFHRYMSCAVTAVAEDGQLFSNYMSRIASYMHGTSFLTVMKRKQDMGEEALSDKKKHIQALQDFFGELKEWCRAYHIQMYFDSMSMDEEQTVDTGLPPEKNLMYTFPIEEESLVEVNHTGDTIQSPFGFIRKLNMIREELWDDTK